MINEAMPLLFKQLIHRLSDMPTVELAAGTFSNDARGALDSEARFCGNNRAMACLAL
jgi:hypothetical protein